VRIQSTHPALEYLLYCCKPVAVNNPHNGGHISVTA